MLKGFVRTQLPLVGKLRSKNLQRGVQGDGCSTRRERPGSVLWFSLQLLLLILVLALGFKLFLNRIASPLFVYWQVLSSPGLCIKHSSSPGIKVG